MTSLTLEQRCREWLVKNHASQDAAGALHASLFAFAQSIREEAAQVADAQAAQQQKSGDAIAAQSYDIAVRKQARALVLRECAQAIRNLP